MNARDRQDMAWQEVVERAYLAGEKAAEEAIPTPMLVGTPKNMMASLHGGDDGGFDPDQPIYRVNEGACGFGWVIVRGDRKFQNYLQAKRESRFPAAEALNHSNGDWRDTSHVMPPSHSEYERGTHVSVTGFGQSVTRKEAFAYAMARVLNEIDGVEAHGSSRLD